jgi:uncharacterized protein YjgD (DUF1641 family)
MIMVKENDLHGRIDAMEKKIDRILEHVTRQGLQREAAGDLLSDFSIIGKDIYDTTVIELEKHSLEISPDELRRLAINLLKNTGNFNEMLELLESLMDLKKDAAPILNEMIIELTGKLHDLENKGYFRMARELARVIDNIVTGFEPDEIQRLADNIVPMLRALGNLTQPEMIAALNNASAAFEKTVEGDIPAISPWRAMRELNSPELRGAIGFLIVFIKNFSNSNNNQLNIK